jgi:hypothetical protein
MLAGYRTVRPLPAGYQQTAIWNCSAPSPEADTPEGTSATLQLEGIV